MLFKNCVRIAARLLVIFKNFKMKKLILISLLFCSCAASNKRHFERSHPKGYKPGHYITHKQIKAINKVSSQSKK